MSIKVNALADAVAERLHEYGNTVTEQLKEGVEEVATGTVNELRTSSPKSTGKYRKGWKKKKAFENATTLRYTVHNATSYQLTHLLEFGHAKVNGGRVEAIPHIAAEEQKAIKQMEKKAKEACQG